MGDFSPTPLFNMKTFVLMIIFLLFPLSVFSDTLKIPFSCWPKELKEEFKKTGRKLDINSNERTKDSWGYILNQGKDFQIFIYKSATQEDFEVIKNIVFKIELKHKGKDG